MPVVTGGPDFRSFGQVAAQMEQEDFANRQFAQQQQMQMAALAERARASEVDAYFKQQGMDADQLKFRYQVFNDEQSRAELKFYHETQLADRRAAQKAADEDRDQGLLQKEASEAITMGYIKDPVSKQYRPLRETDAYWGAHEDYKKQKNAGALLASQDRAATLAETKRRNDMEAAKLTAELAEKGMMKDPVTGDVVPIPEGHPLKGVSEALKAKAGGTVEDKQIGRIQSRIANLEGSIKDARAQLEKKNEDVMKYRVEVERQANSAMGDAELEALKAKAKDADKPQIIKDFIDRKVKEQFSGKWQEQYRELEDELESYRSNATKARAQLEKIYAGKPGYEPPPPAPERVALGRGAASPPAWKDIGSEVPAPKTINDMLPARTTGVATAAAPVARRALPTIEQFRARSLEELLAVRARLNNPIVIQMRKEKGEDVAALAAIIDAELARREKESHEIVRSALYGKE